MTCATPPAQSTNLKAAQTPSSDRFLAYSLCPGALMSAWMWVPGVKPPGIESGTAVKAPASNFLEAKTTERNKVVSLVSALIAQSGVREDIF